MFNRDGIVEEHVKFVISEKKNRGDSHTCIVHNDKEGDILYEATLTYFVKNYGTKEKPRYWTAGPSYVNLPDKVFDNLTKAGLKLDKRMLDKDFDEQVANGTIGKISATINGVDYNALQSKNNPSNTVVYWSIVDPDSPFMGLSSQFVITNSRRSNGRYVVASGNIPGVKSFNMVRFTRRELMAPVTQDANKRKQVDANQARWVNVISSRADALGYLTDTAITTLLLLATEAMLKPTKAEKSA